MTSFGRTARQDVIWVDLNGILDTVGEGALYPPEDSGYTGDDAAALQVEWDSLVDEYETIHTDNETKG